MAERLSSKGGRYTQRSRLATAHICVSDRVCPICAKPEAPMIGPCDECESRFERTGSYAMRGKKKGS